MQIKKLAAYIVLSLLFISHLQAQRVITGTIVNATTGQALEHATVTMPELRLNTVSDKQGGFKIPGIPNGLFVIQFSYVGYQTIVQRIENVDSLIVLEMKLLPMAIEQQEVVISGVTPASSGKTPYQVATVKKEGIHTSGAITMNEALATIPGVSVLSTGIGIGKPVIRGLYGNRIQTVLQNIRFENQQWQDEHNLGLSETGISRIEVIKGPASLLYGSEAIGGVIHVIDEESAPVNTTAGDFSLRMFSNTLGLQSEAGIKKSSEKYNWKIKAGGESHADYQDGTGDRVLNTRFNSIHVKAGGGWKKNNFTSNNNYQFSHEGAGFILIDSLEHLEEDARYSRTLDLPHHLVNFHLVTSENTWFGKKSKFQLDAGAHLNHRQEQEGGNKISIDMQFNSFNLDGKWNHYSGKHSLLIIGGAGSYQTNHNSGKRIIIPDANIKEGAAFVFIKEEYTKLIFEGGVRYDIRDITTLETDILNTIENPNPFDEIMPFQRTFHAVNGSAGFYIPIVKFLAAKINVSSGYRTPNLAELSSNGLHEGTLRYEIGDAGLKTEQSLGLEGVLQYASPKVHIEFSLYRNAFNNYVYLRNTGTEYIGFSVYQYTQTDAAIFGSELDIEINPGFIKWLTIHSSAAFTEGKMEEGGYLPFIPPLKFVNELKAERKKLGFISNAFVKAELINNAAQTKTGPFELSTPVYMLINIGTGGSLNVHSNAWQISISANNLFNETYADHLSRIKPLGLNNIGRNVNINIAIPFYLKKNH